MHIPPWYWFRYGALPNATPETFSTVAEVQSEYEKETAVATRTAQERAVDQTRVADIAGRTEVVISDLELKVHEGINVERVNNGKAALQWNDGLASVARGHSKDMTKRDYFSHDTPEGLGPTDRLHRAGMDCRKGNHWGIAENITIELSSSNVPEVAAKAVDGWMKSPGHRRNLLNGGYDSTGVGASFGIWKGYKSVYLTQVFC